jgi:PAS domain S-box-containing protein
MTNAAGLQPEWRESDRLAALERYEILDTPTEQDFDDIARLASEAFGAPIAVVNLVAGNRQWFKAEIGIGARELPLDVSICAHAILQHDVMVVPDTRLDDRFARNPLVTAEGGLRFYAGALLKTAEGLPIGTVCVLDREARPEGITPFQKLTLEVLARQVMTQLELRRALRQQREDERRHRLILESAVDYGIITMDLNGLVTSWNEGAARLMGWSEEEMCGQLCDNFFSPEDRADQIPAKEMGAALRQGRGTDERWHLRKDGTRFWASGEMMPLTDDDDTPIGFLKILRDRTAQHHAQKALEASEARTRLALEAGGLGTWESTPSLRSMRWDARTRELLGHDPDEPLDYEHSFLARVHPEDRDRIAQINAAALAPGGSGTMDMEYRTISQVDGRERWVHARGALADGIDGEPRFVGTVRDITPEKEAERHRMLLTGELQHRIKNTLAVVQAIVSQSLRGASTPEEARDAIGDRLATLSHAHDLLTQTSWTAAPIHAVIQAVMQQQGGRTGRILIQGPDLLLAAKSALALSMSLHELSTNAAKYGALSNDVGHVELTWKIEHADGEDMLALEWQELGGPPVNLPEKQGFGTRLMKGLSRDLGGQGVLDYDPAGVRWHLRAKLSLIRD